MVANPIVPEREFRGPGCSDECKVLRVFQAGAFGRHELLVHHPEPHEMYGRILAGDPGGLALLETGTLAFNRRNLSVYVEAREITLTATEMRLFAVLADRLDRVVPYGDLNRAIWPELLFDQTAPIFMRSCHTVTTNVNRLRAKLGPSAAGLMQTRKGVGLRLLAWPVGRPAQPIRPTHNTLNGRWSHTADRCINPACGTTERGHKSGGRCSRCFGYWRDHGVEHPGHDLRTGPQRRTSQEDS